jgi:3-hydroxyisobutyrate dehydrogenase-like beta-hydroxyacid dehydrogenase
MRIAIVGTGYVAPQYARTLIEDGAEIVCWDIDQGRQAAFATEFHAEQAVGLADIASRDVAVAVNLGRVRK